MALFSYDFETAIASCDCFFLQPRTYVCRLVPPPVGVFIFSIKIESTAVLPQELKKSHQTHLVASIILFTIRE